MNRHAKEAGSPSGPSVFQTQDSFVNLGKIEHLSNWLMDESEVFLGTFICRWFCAIYPVANVLCNPR